VANRVFIEEDGVLYRGVARAWPDEVWSTRTGTFLPYRGSTPKPTDWGEVIEAHAAEKLIRSG
jgi:hypothetical protein